MSSLKSEEIRLAQEKLKDAHPLKSVKLHRLFPFLKFLKKYRKDQSPKSENPYLDFDTSNAKTQEIEYSKSLKKHRKENFLILGFGINYYFYQVKILILCFLLISLFSLPAIFSYSFQQENPVHTGVLFKASLGNMGNKNMPISIGYSSVKCTRGQSFGKDLLLTCPGTGIKIGKFISAGIVDPSEKTSNRCFFKNSYCESIMDYEKIKKQFEKSCANKDTCHLPLDSSQFRTNPSYACPTIAFDTFFVQYSCIQLDHILDEKKSTLQGVVMFDFGAMLIFLSFWFYMKKRLPAKFQQWDSNTKTASDYTVEYKIPKNHYSMFCLKNNLTDEDSKIYQYKLYLMEEFAKVLKVVPPVIDSLAPVRVADISFAFKNQELIQLLKTRGTYVINNQEKKVQTIEKKIDHMIQHKFDDCTVPISAFVTLEDEEAFLRAISLQKGRKKCLVEFNDSVVNFKHATEPTNIIWENRSISLQERISRISVSSLWIIALLAISFLIIFICKMKSLSMQKHYPKVDCSLLDFDYDKYPIKFEEAAIDEWYNFNHISDYEYTGILQCFCNEFQIRNKNTNIDEVIFTSQIKKDSKSHYVSGNICNKIRKDIIGTGTYDIGLTFIIVGINVILKILVRGIIQFNRHKTVSKFFKNSALFIFFAQTLNTTVVLILVNANLDFFWPLGIIFHGKFSDFSQDWFEEVGKILLSAQFLIAVVPIFEVLFFYCLQRLLIFWDRGGFHYDSMRTKCKTIQQYINLYIGDECYMDVKYSELMNLCFISIIYGTGLPLSYLITLFGVIVIYLRDRVFLAYYYRRPPMFDDILGKQSLDIFPWAVIFHFLIGFWMLSNNDLLNNDLQPIKKANELGYTSHSFFCYAFPLLGSGIALLTLFISKNFVKLVLVKIGIIKEGGFKLKEQEMLLPYFSSLSQDDVKWWVNEEDYCRNILNIKILNEVSYQKLKDRQIAAESEKFLMSKSVTKIIQNVPNYDILANPRYTMAFQYFPYSKRVSSDITSAKVRIALNLANYSKARANKFSMRNIRVEEFIKMKGLAQAILKMAEEKINKDKQERRLKIEMEPLNSTTEKLVKF